MAINISLNKLPWYGQLGVFVLIGAGAAGAFWNYYAVPKNAEIETRQAALNQIRGEINRGLTTARRLPEFRSEVSTLELQLDRLSAVLPEQQDVADLLNRVNAMAVQSNLRIVGFIPQTESKKAMHTEWPIGLKLEGSYHDLGMFLERISKFPRIINVGDIKINARTSSTDGSTITAECTATTFVLLDQKEVAAAAAKAGAKPGAAPAAPKKTE